MRFGYQWSFDVPSPNAYETLLWNVMKSATALFMRDDQVQAVWLPLMPVREGWKAAAPIDLPKFAADMWGPEATQGLLAQGQRWPLPTELVSADKKRLRGHNYEKSITFTFSHIAFDHTDWLPSGHKGRQQH